MNRDSIWHKLIRPFRVFGSQFLAGDHRWRWLRLAVLLMIIGSLALGGRFLEAIVMEGRLARPVLIPGLGPAFSLIPQPVLEFAGAFFMPAALRYWYPPLLAAGLAFCVGALYLRDLFELQSLSSAGQYLFNSLFGIDYPRLIIGDGKKEAWNGQPNLIDSIGGPGYVYIRLGNAVLFEKMSGPSSVYGTGRHFLRRFETIREIVNLAEQHRAIEAADACTKDGIPVTVRNIEATFRIRADKRQGRSETNPYPFAPGAIWRVAYNRAVSPTGLIEWQQAAINLVKRQILDWIATQNLDAITAPLDEDPREQLRLILNSRRVRNLFRDIGVELLWVSTGHIDSPAEVDEQRLENWRAFWETNNQVVTAQAEATQITYKILARSETQADTLQAFTNALHAAATGIGPGAELCLNDILLVSVAQILEAMTAPPGLAEAQSFSDNGSSAETSEAAVTSRHIYRRPRWHSL